MELEKKKKEKQLLVTMFLQIKETPTSKTNQLQNIIKRA